jgi:hypothetical protein
MSVNANNNNYHDGNLDGFQERDIFSDIPKVMEKK